MGFPKTSGKHAYPAVIEPATDVDVPFDTLLNAL